MISMLRFPFESINTAKSENGDQTEPDESEDGPLGSGAIQVRETAAQSPLLGGFGFVGFVSVHVVIFVVHY